MDTRTRRRLKQIAHHLHPVVTIGDAGVSDGVIAETNRALADHELIKVRIHAEDRDDREQLAGALTGECQAELVQKIGKIVVLYRKNPQPNANLSNVLRAPGQG